MDPVRSRDRNNIKNKIMKLNKKEIINITKEISEKIAIYF